MGEIAMRGQQGFCIGAACGEHDMFPDTDGVAGKPEGLCFRHDETPGRINSFGKNFLPIVIERGRKIEKFTAAQGA